MPLLQKMVTHPTVARNIRPRPAVVRLGGCGPCGCRALSGNGAACAVCPCHFAPSLLHPRIRVAVHHSALQLTVCVVALPCCCRPRPRPAYVTHIARQGLAQGALLPLHHAARQSRQGANGVAVRACDRARCSQRASAVQRSIQRGGGMGQVPSRGQACRRAACAHAITLQIQGKVQVASGACGMRSPLNALVPALGGGSVLRPRLPWGLWS